jgi:hypothetical protein
MGNELTNEQFTAIRRSIDLGRTLREDIPEIGDLFREGNYLSTISEELNIISRYGVTDNVAMFGVHHAISGHDGSFNLDSYVGLIPDEDERKRLGRKQRQKLGVWGI